MLSVLLIFSFLITLLHSCEINHEYYDPVTSSCKPCQFNCLTCLDANICVTCTEQYYLDEITNQCELCPYGCSICANSTSCTSCSEGLYLNGDGICQSCGVGIKSCTIAVIESCDTGYFMLGSICAGCIDNCAQCSDFATCNQCIEGFFVESSTFQCLACSENCEICTDASTCTSCQQGFEISGGLCQIQDCSSISPFCRKCSFGFCLECQIGKYANQEGGCSQGASILCLQSTGPYHTDCETSNFGCPFYAQPQTDIFSGAQLDICLPSRVDSLKQQIYYKSNTDCPSVDCASSQSSIWNINNLKAFFEVKYYLSIKIYTTAIQQITVELIQDSAAIASQILDVDATTEFSQNLIDSSCGSCQFGIIRVEGYLVGSVRSDIPQISVTSSESGSLVLEAVLITSICTVTYCEVCSSEVDCLICEEPYYLQMIECVTACDPGFYQYDRSCVLQCPDSAYPVRVSYQCIDCISPCSTCQSQTVCLSCVDGYFLDGSQCLLECSSTQLFANLTSGSCETCSNPCTKCQVQINPLDSSDWSVSCLACRTGYVLTDGSCVYICPQGNFANFISDTSTCLQCSSECSSCLIEENICLSCIDSYVLSLDSSMCQSGYTCPDGYFQNATLNICTSCHYPCKTCQEDEFKCTSCLKGSLYLNQCPLQCPQGYFNLYSNDGQSTCEVCISPCVTCMSSSFCLSCQTDKFLHEGICYDECPLSTLYEQLSNNTCIKCIPPCAQCISETQCSSCSTGFLDSSLKKCTLLCNSTSYVSEEFECTLCPSPCISCFSGTLCSQCELPYVLYEENCLTETDCQNANKFVLANYNYDTGSSVHTSSICVSCTYPCTSCQGSQIQCTSCATSYLLVEQLQACVQQCPLSYYQDGSTCQKCDSVCLGCEGTSTFCTECGTGMFLHENTCIQQCPSLYYGDNVDSICKSCVSPCSECYNVYLCKTCEAEKVLYNKVCIDDCPVGTIHNTDTDECDLCTHNCEQCSIVTSNCTTCPNTYYFFENQCLEICPNFYYADTRSEACESCLEPCQLCLSDVKCSSCIDTYYLYGTQCLLECPDTYFEITGICETCNTTICYTCDLTANDCTSCVSPYFFDAIQSQSCVTECPLGSYPDSQTLTCKQCTYPCSECTDSFTCQACFTNYKLFNYYCYSACPVGYYTSGYVCNQCMENCEICQSQTVCLKCTTNYYANENSQCVSNCGVGFYKNFEALTSYPVCSLCPTQCKECTQYYQCTKCSTTQGYDLFLFNGLCLDACPIMYFSLQIASSDQYICSSCPSNCNKCSNVTTCLQCLSSYMYQNLCYISCPSRTYLFNEENCIDCSSPCQQCSGEFSCLTCLDGYFYYQNYCLTTCPDDVWVYPENGSCLAECPYNKYLEMKECYVVGCGGMMVHLGGYCLQKCPDNYYVDQNQNCIGCSVNQQACQHIFSAKLTILRSYNLKLSLYFNQMIKEETLDTQKILITFSDFNDAQTQLDYTYLNISFDEYSLTVEYAHDEVYLYDVSLTIPYIQSAQSLQSIEYNTFEQPIYSYNDYSDQNLKAIEFLGILAILFVAMVFLCTVTNIIVKSSSFFQLLDFMQFVAASLYLEIQFPPVLEHYLKNLAYILWSFVPQIANFTPYAQSPSKFIEYFVDTSILRSQGLTFILFSILFIVSLIIILINKFKPEYCVTAVQRIRYRHLTDLFGVFMLPLLIFAFHFNDSNPIDIVVSIFIILISAGYLVLISYKLITAKSYSQIPGLTGDLQNIESTLGKLYTPFAFVRKIIFAFVLCIQPDKPISTLTILLVFTTLILVCLIFYQPFQHIITDYVCIFMEVCLVIFVFFLILFGLNATIGEKAHSLGIVSVVISSLGILAGLIWLIYLTVLAIKKFHTSFKETKNDLSVHNQNEQNDSHKNHNENDQQFSIIQNDPKIIKVRNRISMQSAMNSEMYDDEASANMFISKKNDMIQDEDGEGQNQQFRHWNASESDPSEEAEQGGPPMYLMKIEKME